MRDALLGSCRISGDGRWLGGPAEYTNEQHFKFLKEFLASVALSVDRRCTRVLPFVSYGGRSARRFGLGV